MIRSSQTEVTVEFMFRADVIDYLLISRDNWLVFVILGEFSELEDAVCD